MKGRKLTTLMHLTIGIRVYTGEKCIYPTNTIDNYTKIRNSEKSFVNAIFMLLL